MVAARDRNITAGATVDARSAAIVLRRAQAAGVATTSALVQIEVGVRGISAGVATVLGIRGAIDKRSFTVAGTSTAQAVPIFIPLHVIDLRGERAENPDLAGKMNSPLPLRGRKPRVISLTGQID